MDPLDAFMAGLEKMGPTAQVDDSGPTLAEALNARRRRHGPTAGSVDTGAEDTGMALSSDDDEDMEPEESCKTAGGAFSVTMIAQAVAERVDWVGSSHNNVRGIAAQSTADKAALLHSLVLRDPAMFLERYGASVPPHLLGAFDSVDRYDVRHHVASLRQAGGPQVSSVVRNRRFVYALRLQESGSYFSAAEMKERAPRLFDQIMGDTAEATPAGSVSFSDMLLHSATRQREAATEPESDSEVESDADEEAGGGPAPTARAGKRRRRTEAGAGDVEVSVAEGAGAATSAMARTEGAGVGAGAGAGGSAGAGAAAGGMLYTPDDVSTESVDTSVGLHVTDEERLSRHRKLLQIMVRRFVDGHDRAVFDYTSIDNDKSLDVSIEGDGDIEEAYFS